MLLSLSLARINPLMTTAIVELIHATEGARLPVGAKLLDVTVDLSDSSPQDCPPLSQYRIVLREAAWLRRWLVKPADEPEVGAPLALFSTAADEPLDGVPARAIRVMTAGIVWDAKAYPWDQAPA
jgi:hypothetical protein